MFALSGTVVLLSTYLWIQENTFSTWEGQTISIYNSSNLCVCVCVCETAVSRQPLVRSNWNLPGILMGTCGRAFSRVDINRTSGSQVTAIYLPTNGRTRCYGVTSDVTIIILFFARLTSQLFFFFVWYDVTITYGPALVLYIIRAGAPGIAFLKKSICCCFFSISLWVPKTPPYSH